jgi:uncharacterized protein
MSDSNDQVTPPEDDNPMDEQQSNAPLPDEELPPVETPVTQPSPPIPPPPPQPPYNQGQEVNDQSSLVKSEKSADESTKDEQTFAILAHCLVFVGGIFAPLIIYLIKKDDSKFVAYHSLQAIFFQLAILIASFISGLLCTVCIGFFLLPFVFIAAIWFPIAAAMAANKGEWYSYPLTGGFVER